MGIVVQTMGLTAAMLVGFSAIAMHLVYFPRTYLNYFICSVAIVYLLYAGMFFLDKNHPGMVDLKTCLILLQTPISLGIIPMLIIASEMQYQTIIES